MAKKKKTKRCSKVCYDSRLEANMALLRCWKRHRNERRVYLCPEHKKYHLTSMDQPLSKSS
jgi:hypothetical protein